MIGVLLGGIILGKLLSGGETKPIKLTKKQYKAYLKDRHRLSPVGSCSPSIATAKSLSSAIRF